MRGGRGRARLPCRRGVAAHICAHLRTLDLVPFHTREAAAVIPEIAEVNDDAINDNGNGNGYVGNDEEERDAVVNALKAVPRLALLYQSVQFFAWLAGEALSAAIGDKLLLSRYVFVVAIYK